MSSKQSKVQWKNYLADFSPQPNTTAVPTLQHEAWTKIYDAFTLHMQPVGAARRKRRVERTRERQAMGLDIKRRVRRRGVKLRAGEGADLPAPAPAPPAVAVEEVASAEPDGRKEVREPRGRQTRGAHVPIPEGFIIGMNQVLRSVSNGTALCVVVCLSLKPASLLDPLLHVVRTRGVPVVGGYDVGPQLARILDCRSASVCAFVQHQTTPHPHANLLELLLQHAAKLPPKGIDKFLQTHASSKSMHASAEDNDSGPAAKRVKQSHESVEYTPVAIKHLQIVPKKERKKKHGKKTK